MPGNCILVVEDDAPIRQLIRARLRMAGYDVHTARNGNEAIKRILELSPDAMVLDINMPEIDGFGVLETMRSRPDFPRPATMVLTARHAEEDVRQALSLGAKDYLTKPFNEVQLLSRVARLLRPPLKKPTPPAPQKPDNGGEVML